MRSIRLFIARLAAPLRFWRDDHASLTVEAVLVLPLLFWTILATFTIFDTFHIRSLAIKGNFAVSDLLSRETNDITPTYLSGIEQVYERLTGSGDTSWVRVTLVHCDDACDDPANRTLGVDWSQGTDGKASLTQADVNSNYTNAIPLMPVGERVIMVETQLHYVPPFNSALAGLGDRDMTDIVMTRPRFVQQLAWDADG